MIRRISFATLLLLGISFSHGFASDAAQIETRVIDNSKGKTPFPGKAFSFLLENEKSQIKSGKDSSSVSYIAGILTPDQTAKIKGLGRTLPNITLKSGQKGTVSLAWNSGLACPVCDSGDKKACRDKFGNKIGMACAYRPVIRGNQINLRVDYRERQFVGFLDPALLAKNTLKSKKLTRKLSAESKQNPSKPIAIFAMKEVNTDVRLQDGQTLVIFLEKTGNRRKYLLITARKAIP